MRSFKHVRTVTLTPEQAQISNFQVKLEFTTSVIDRLLLVDRQNAWKIVPGGGGIDTGDITGITDIPTNLLG